MGSREKNHTTPLLSSLVVRATDSGGGGGGPGGGSDYEPGEVRRDPPSYSRSDRFPDNDGYRIRAGSGSPVRRRNGDHRYSPEFDHSGGPPRSRGFSNGRDPRYRDYSPPYGRGRGGGRFGRGAFSGRGFGPGQLRGEGMPRNVPNVRPREGDWLCSDPSCKNLNFARREYCNNCNRHRYAPVRSPRKGYSGPPPPHAHPRRFVGPPMDRSPGRSMNSYRSPPRGLARDNPREFGAGGPPHPRLEGRFPDHHLRRDRPDFPEVDYRERNRFDRPVPLDWGPRDHGRDDLFNERKGYERRPPSPPLPPPPTHRGRWGRDVRERSRSPIRSGPPPEDYRRDTHMGRGRDDRRVMGRDGIGDAY